MSNATRYLFPLISDKVTRQDLIEKTGFVDVYTTDIDRPYMEDCVFVLYKRVNTEEYFKCTSKLESLESYFGKKYLLLDNVPHIMYTFKNAKKLKDIKNYIEIGNLVSLDTKLKIYEFWKGLAPFAFVEELFNDMRIKNVVNVSKPEDYVDTDSFNEAV